MDKEYNVVIIGYEYVGKSNILQRIIKYNFNEDHYPTHGTNIKAINWYLNGDTYKLKIRDAPGMDKYIEFKKEQLKMADIILLCYDATDQQSFDEIKKYF